MNAKNRLFICTSNHKNFIPQAILMPGRLENHIEFGFPTDEDRLKIFFTKCWEYKIPSLDTQLEEKIIEKKGYNEAQIDKLTRFLALKNKEKNEDLSLKDIESLYALMN